MKIKQSIIIVLLGLVTSFASVQTATASANFVFTLPGTLTTTTGGTFGPNDSFSFSIRLNFPSTPPTDVASLSYWFEVPTAFAPFITITSQTITDTANGATPWSVLAAQGTDYPMSFNGAADAGFLRNSGISSNGDLGGGTPSTLGVAPSASTYYVSTLTFQLTNAPLGSYTLQTTQNPLTSTSDASGGFFDLPTASYTITIVPEPATWSLMALAGLGAFGLNLLRAKRKS